MTLGGFPGGIYGGIGQLGAARKTAAGVYVLDNFNDADGTALPAHTPDVAPGGSAWANISTGNFTVQSNRAVSVGVSGGAVIDAGQADCKITLLATVYIASGAIERTCGVVARRDPLTGYYWKVCVSGTGSIRIYESGASLVERAAVFGLSFSAGQLVTFEVTLAGQTISALVDGHAISYSSAAMNEAATHHGFFLRRYDNVHYAESIKMEPLL